MSKMLSFMEIDDEDEKIASIVATYGNGFDLIYLDGKAEGISEGKLEFVKNLLKRGVNENIISESSGFSIDEIREIRRTL